MSYSDFTTISKVKEVFNLTTVEGTTFLSEVEPITPSETLTSFLKESLSIASSGSDKARSEGIIYPVLLEVRWIKKRQISLFSGEDFTVDKDAGLNGVCDFLISCSPEVLEIEAPSIIVTEAKKADLRAGVGQCITEMVAAQRLTKLKAETSLQFMVVSPAAFNGDFSNLRDKL